MTSSMGTSFGLLVKSAVLCWFGYFIIKLSEKLLSTKSKWKKGSTLTCLLFYCTLCAVAKMSNTELLLLKYMHQFVTLKIP